MGIVKGVDAVDVFYQQGEVFFKKATESSWNTRKVDSLGRVAVPIALLKQLNWLGAVVDISTRKDKIVLKKNNEQVDVKQRCIEALTILGDSVILVDKDKIAGLSGDIDKMYLNTKIKHDVLKQTKELGYYKKGQLVNLIKGDFKSQFIHPITDNNSKFKGALIVFSRNKDIDDSILRITKEIVNILNKSGGF